MSLQANEKIVKFDWLCVQVLAQEVQATLPARIQKISGFEPDVVCFELYSQRTRRYFVTCLKPGLGTFFLDSTKPSLVSEISGFIQKLRQYLDGAVVLSVEQVPGDRVMTFYLTSESGSLELVLELVPTKPNLILLDERGVTRLSFRPGRLDFDGSEKRSVDLLESPTLSAVSEIAGREIAERMVAAQKGGFQYERGIYPLDLTPVLQPQKRFSTFSEALAFAFRSSTQIDELETLRSELRKVCSAQVKRLSKEAERLETERRGSEVAQSLQEQAELLLAYKPDLRERTIALENLAGEKVAIQVDPANSAIEEAEKRFKAARKLRAAATRAESLVDDAKTALAEAQALLGMVADASDLSTLERVERECFARGWLKSPKAKEKDATPGKSKFEGHKIRKFDSPDGYEVLVGETATANDYLTTRIAGSKDLWLHVRGHRSAHVVIRTGNKPEGVPRTTLEFAAKLAARNSDLKHSSLVPVDYVQRKHVRKPKKSAPGAALYTQEKTLNVDPDL
jgi:predicted ribosome quality control (RQC) complex YloA/Tae2 family protein